MAAGTMSIVAPLRSRRQYPREVLHARAATVITFAVTEPDQFTPVSLAGLTARLRMREHLRAGAYAVDVACELVAGGVGGLCTAAIPAGPLATSGDYPGELAIFDATLAQIAAVSFLFTVQAGASI